MIISLQGIANVPVRSHPYDGAKYDDPRARHYEFVGNLPLIREVLEDFKPWEKYEAVELFYQLLEWINGPESVFESSDCRLVPPQKNTVQQFPFRFVLNGRVMLFFRDLKLNFALLEREHRYFVHERLAQLALFSDQALKPIYPEVNSQWIQIFFFPARFRACNGTFGHQITYQFNSFGNTEKEAFESFSYFSKSILKVLKQANEFWTARTNDAK